jgi:hypothetical protein
VSARFTCAEMSRSSKPAMETCAGTSISGNPHSNMAPWAGANHGQRVPGAHPPRVRERDRLVVMHPCPMCFRPACDTASARRGCAADACRNVAPTLLDSPGPRVVQSQAKHENAYKRPDTGRKCVTEPLTEGRVAFGASQRGLAIISSDPSAHTIVPAARKHQRTPRTPSHSVHFIQWGDDHERQKTVANARVR